MRQARFPLERTEWVYVPADKQIPREQILVPLLCARCKARIGAIHIRPDLYKQPFEWELAAGLEPGYREAVPHHWRATKDAVRRYREFGQLQPRRYGQHLRDVMQDRKSLGPDPIPNQVENWPFIVECHACDCPQKIGAALVTKLVKHVWSNIVVVASPATQC